MHKYLCVSADCGNQAREEDEEAEISDEDSYEDFPNKMWDTYVLHLGRAMQQKYVWRWSVTLQQIFQFLLSGIE